MYSKAEEQRLDEIAAQQPIPTTLKFGHDRVTINVVHPDYEDCVANDVLTLDDIRNAEHSTSVESSIKHAVARVAERAAGKQKAKAGFEKKKAAALSWKKRR
jgi:hypothetical protein